MRFNALAVSVAATLLSCPLHAADIEAGKAKAETCIACHGENGISQMENAPSLAGQQDQYIQWQLIFFRAGTRKNEQMAPISQDLSNEDIRNLGAYFASLKPPVAPEDKDGTLSAKGKEEAAEHRCGACHLESYAGSKAVPRLAAQREDYLVKALKDYKSSTRSGGGMAAMAEIAYQLGEDEITALAHYLAHLKN